MAEARQGFGALLRRTRLRSGLTQENLAERSGLSTRTISDLERGMVARPRGSSLDLLVSALAPDPDTAAALVRMGRSTGAADMVPSATTEQPLPAALGSVTEPPRELPAAVSDFTGRERELAELAGSAARALAEESQAPAVLVLSGPPGVGKTALAVRLGHLLTSGTPIMQLFVELGDGSGRPLAPTEALRQLLVSLGVAYRDCPGDLEQRVRRYRSLLYQHRALVVLDNATDEAQVRPLLPGGPGCVVLITSRNTLAGLSATARLALGVWPPDEARTFLSQVAGPDRMAAEPGAVDELIQLCGRLPLALRIAGNQLACRPGWTAGYLAQRLCGERHRLALLSAGDLGILPAFDLAYEQLKPEAQAIFRRLPLLPGTSFSADMIEALSEPGWDASPAVDELVSASLIEAALTPGRYQMHDLLRLYAQDRLGEGAPPDLLAVERRVMCRLLENATAAGNALSPRDAEQALALPAFHNRESAVSWLDAEISGVLTAATRAADLGLAAEAFTAAGILSWYFDLRCQWHAWQTLCETLLPVARSRGDRQATIDLLNGLGLTLGEQRRFAESVGLHQEAVQLARQAGNQSEEGLAIDFLAHAYSELGKDDDAVAGHQQALSLFRAAGDARSEAMAINHCGTALRKAGRLAEAADHHQRALEAFDTLGDTVGSAMARLSLGFALTDLSQHTRAAEEFRLALAAFGPAQDRWGQAQAMYGLGCALAAVAQDRATPDTALEEKTTLDTAASGKSARGRVPPDMAAVAWLRQSCEAFRLIGDSVGERDARHALASVLCAWGAADDAQACEIRIRQLDAAIGDVHAPPGGS